MANKQDKEGFLSPEIVEEKLGMKQCEGRNYHVEGISAVSGKEIKEALDCLSSQLKK